jgi:inorganic pyrophosphatase/exopolyphosphatase
MNQPTIDQDQEQPGRSCDTLLSALATCKLDFLSALSRRDQQCIAVIGNEGGDMDSCVSALCEALVLRERAVHGECVVPVIPVTREELQLRRDITLLFARLGLTPEEHLIFIDQARLGTLHSENRLNLILVDHNKPAIELDEFKDRVVGTIDHHAFSGAPVHPELVRDALRVNSIETVGSACSLIFREACRASASIMHDWRFAALLSAAIKLDTKDLKDRVTTCLDRHAVASLDRIIGSRTGVPSYSQLLIARSDTNGMIPQQLVAKDRKWFLAGNVVFGIASMPLALAEISGSAKGLFGLDGAVSAHLRNRLGNHIPQLFLLHCEFKGAEGWQREVALCYLSDQSDLGRTVGTHLGQINGFRRQESTYGDHNLVVESFNVPADLSRKRVSPLIEQFLETLGPSAKL